MYAVKELWDCDLETGREDWVHTAVFKEKSMAFRYKKDRMKDYSRSFPLVDPKVVKVDDEFVGIWVNLAGNRIY